MYLRSLLSAIVFLSCATGLAHAQQKSQQLDPKNAVWHIEINDHNKAYVAVSQIVTIAFHQYLLNGENLISEVTVDTLGNNSLRFYYIHPEEDRINLRDVQKNAAQVRKRISQEQSRQKADNTVAAVKFPEGSYAHTIEYQLSSLDTLEDLYKSIVSVWEKSNTDKLNSFRVKQD